MLNNLQNLYQGLRSTTTRPNQTKPVINVHSRDTSLNAARAQYSKDQENNINFTNTDNRVAYKNAQNNITKSLYTKQESRNDLKPSEAPFGSINSSCKPPAVQQSTDSPPSCSLTCSPDRTVKRPTSRDGSKSLQDSKKAVDIAFQCSECNASHKGAFLPYGANAQVGNCTNCGNFQTFKGHVSQGIRDGEQKFRAEVPMDVILEKLIEDTKLLCPQYNASAFYLSNREVFVEWMFDLAEKLHVQPETFHHSVNLFDAYLMRPDIQKHLGKLTHFQGQTKHNIVTLIALTSLFISAKYLEKTYPGINQLLNYIGIPYCYEEFVAQEKDMLETLGWEIQFISIHNVLSHFLCQGIIFSTDRLAGSMRPNTYTVQVLAHNCDIFTSLCLKKFEFLQYDTLVIACSIIMAARKICHLQELWPDELVAMSGDRIKQPMLKKCMRHIISFYEEISCSNSNTQQSSPEHPSTVQKTVKRTAQATISTKKKSRGDLNRGDKSQEQTTSKKAPASVSRIAGQPQAAQTANVSMVNQTRTETVVTPAKNSMPRAKPTNVAKASNDKATVVSQAKRTSSQVQAMQRSTTKNDLSSSKKDESRFIKSVESRADSQPAKKTHTLMKQDSSVYLKGNSLEKVLKRSQRASNLSSVDGRGKSQTKSNERSVNYQEAPQFLLNQYSKYSVVSTNGDNSSGKTSSLKKVVPHPLLREQFSSSLNKTKTEDASLQVRSASLGLSNNQTTAQTKGSADNAQPVGLMQQRSLAKQFEQMDLRSKKGFVVNTLTTANQRASSSKSAGITNFVQKLVGQQKQDQISSMIKINNLTGQEVEILGTRSGSLGSTSKPQQKIPSQRECAEPKVISCNYKKQQQRFDYSSIQMLMTNLKQTSQSTASSGPVPSKQYARSTSRSKETGIAQVSKLTALLGKPMPITGRNNQPNGSASSGQVGMASVPNNIFHPRPQNLRVKVKQSEVAQSQIVSATQRSFAK